MYCKHDVAARLSAAQRNIREALSLSHFLGASKLSGDLEDVLSLLEQEADKISQEIKNE